MGECTHVARIVVCEVSQDQSRVFFWMSWDMLVLDGALWSNVTSVLILSQLFIANYLDCSPMFLPPSLATSSPLSSISLICTFENYYAWAVFPGLFVYLDICLCMRRPTPVNAKWHSLSALLVLSAAVRAHQLEHTPGWGGKSNTARTVMKYDRALCSSMNSINSQTNNFCHYQNSI